jgi:dCMP deaminase
LEKQSKTILDKFKNYFTQQMHIYTDLLQKIGNNLRKSGNSYLEDPKPEEIFLIPRIISNAIEIIRKAADIEEESDHYIVIDALRHPYEIKFLNRSISNFFTIAVNTANEDRIKRLLQLQYNQKQIDNLDEIEYPDEISKAKDYSTLVKQNIQSCLEISDIYISNTGDKDESIKQMSKQLLRYVSLMQHPGLITPTPEERCMQSAVVARSNSGCISRQVGAVVTDEHFSIKSIGWNDVPQGQVPCLLRNVNHVYNGKYDKGSYSKYELGNEKFKEILIKEFSMNETTQGRNISFCFKSVYTKTDDKLKGNQVHTRSLHAEENAFLQIAKYGGQAIIGGNLFTTASPCELCAKKAFQLGIKNIFYIDPYPGIASEHILSSGTNKPNLKLFDGAVRSAYHRLYEAVMPYKDELSFLIKADPELKFSESDS